VSGLEVSEYFGLTRIRVNIANAAVFGMKEELGLVGNQYNVALVILFVRSFEYPLSWTQFLAQIRTVHRLRDPRKLFAQKVQTARLA